MIGPSPGRHSLCTSGGSLTNEIGDVEPELVVEASRVVLKTRTALGRTALNCYTLAIYCSVY